MRNRRALVCVSFLASLAGCSSPAGSADAGAQQDAFAVRDASIDSGAADTGAADTGAGDTGSGDTGAGDTGADDAGPEDANVDAAPLVDAGPLPLFDPVDDRTVVLGHRLACPPALAFEADGTPLLAIATDGNHLRVVRLDAGAWAQLGPDVSDASASLVGGICPALVVAADGTRYVAFEQGLPTGTQVRVRRYTGTAWEDDFSLDSTVGTAAADLDMALDTTGRPVLALSVPNPGMFANSLVVYRRTGTTFVQDGGFGGLGIGRLRIAVRPDDTVVALVAHVGGFSTGINLIELSGGVFTSSPDVDGVGDTTQFVVVGDVFVDATRAWVTWQHSTSAGANVVHVSRFEGGAFTAIDTESVTGTNPELTVRAPDDLTWVYSVDNHLRLSPHDGTAFGAPADGPMVVYLGRLAWDHDQLYLAYTTSAGGGSATAELVRVNLP